MVNNNESSSAVGSDVEASRQLTHLREAIETLQASLDEIRNQVDRLLGVPRTGDPVVKDFAESVECVEPDRLPDDVPKQVRSAVAVCLWESRAGGVDSLTHQHRPDETNSDLPGNFVQPLLWSADQEVQNDKETPQEEIHRKTPYTFKDFQAFLEKRQNETIAAEEWKAHFYWFIESKEVFIAGLVSDYNAKQLKAIAMRLGAFDAGRNSKSQDAESIYRSVLQQYILGPSFQWQPMSETIEEAAVRQVEAITDKEIAKERERVATQKAEREKALNAPETLSEFRRFLIHQSQEDLSDEQIANWDALEAEVSRKARKEAKQSDTVEQFRSEELENVSLRIIEGFHGKRQVPLHIVQISTRVERDTFNELKVKAKQLGGWWSSFKKATAGFQFLDRDPAEKFVSLTQGNADSSEAQFAKKLFKMGNASDRLRAVAETLETNANATLAADETKLKNTTRRASMAAGQRANAFGDLAAAKTLRSIADSLETGDATYLDRIWNSKQIGTLKQILRQARWARIRYQLTQEGHDQRSHAWNLRHDELEREPYQDADVRHAKYPVPYLYKNQLAQAIETLRNRPGVKQVSAKVQRLIDRTSPEQDFIEFTSEHEVTLLEDFLERAKVTGYQVHWFENFLDGYNINDFAVRTSTMFTSCAWHYANCCHI